MTPLAQLDDPTDFNSPSIQSLDSSLRCQICHELFTAPVILTNCSHTFDSLCLRNHFKLSKKCPQCQVEANEDRIRRNLIVEEMVNNWNKARPDLLALQQFQFQSTSHLLASTLPSPAPIPSTSRSPLPPPPPSSSSSKRPHPVPSPQHRNSKPKPKSQPPLGSISLEEEDASSDVEVIDDPGPSARKRPKRDLTNGNGKESSTDKTGKGKGRQLGGGKIKFQDPSGGGGDPTDPSLLVSCPLCQKQVKNGVISSHIDSGCKKFLSSNIVNTRSNSGVFGRMMGSSSSSTGGGGSEKPNLNSEDTSGFPEQDSTKYLPLPNYAHKKLRDLESLLRALNLPLTVPSQHSKTTASKIEYLKRRHSQYLTLWNSNVDLGENDSRRVGPGELRRRLGEWEKVLDKEERGKEKEKEKDKGDNKEYIKSHENEFKDLIAQARISHEKNKNKSKMKSDQDDMQVATEEQQASNGSAVAMEKEEQQPASSDGENHNRQEDDKLKEGEVDEINALLDSLGKGPEGEPIELNKSEGTINDLLNSLKPREEDVTMRERPQSPSSRPQTSSTVLPTSPSPVSLPSPKLTSRKQVRIVTPPPQPPPLSPIATPPPLNDGRERRDRSSSILEYDENFFPPTSQRVREIDWEGIRRGREEQEEQEEEEEDEQEGGA